MIDPSTVAFFIPNGLKTFKLNLFNRIGATVSAKGGAVVRGDLELLAHKVRKGRTPIIGCMPEVQPYLDGWKREGRDWIYWDRGYWLRVFATDLPEGKDGGFYRWHVNSYQAQEIREVPADRLKKYPVDLSPWAKSGDHIVLASPSPTYERVHGIEGWTERTLAELKTLTDRPIVIRDKEMQRAGTDRKPGGRRLRDDLKGAHCLVTHGSNAAVESVIMGCPVFTHSDSAASLVGRTDLKDIEKPIYPDREPWVRSLAYSNFNEAELTNGDLWRLLA